MKHPNGPIGPESHRLSPVDELVGQALPVTLELAALSMLVGVAISILFGVAAARRRGRLSDLIITSGALVGISLPSFVIALLAIYVCSLKLRLLPFV